MSIVINGKLPMNVTFEAWFYPSGNVAFYDSNGNSLGVSKWKELPPHGRLGDLDKLDYASIESADVRPVKEGHWVKARGSWCTPGGDPVWECSECGKGVHVYGIEHGTYGSDIADGQWVSCPNCGAWMGGTP